MYKPLKLKAFSIIPEHIIVESARDLAKADGHINNSFTKYLEIASVYKKAGCTPVYIFDVEKKDIHVVNASSWGTYIH